MGNNLKKGFGFNLGGGGGAGGSGISSMFSVSGTENSLNEDRWLAPRRYKLADNPTGTSSGDYLSGASEDFSISELTNQSFTTNIRLENFLSNGITNPIRYEVMFSMQQTSLDADLQFGIFKSSPTDGDTTLSYSFTSYVTSQPHATTNGIKKISGTITDTISASTICSFGFHNPSGTPATQDVDDLRYWITVYFN